MDRCSCQELWWIWDLTYLQVNKSPCHRVTKFLISKTRGRRFLDQKQRTVYYSQQQQHPDGRHFYSGPQVSFSTWRCSESPTRVRLRVQLAHPHTPWAATQNRNLNFCTSIPQYQWRIGSQTPCECQNLQMLETLAFGPSHLPSTFADTEEWLYWGSKPAASLFWRETSSPFSKTLGQTTIPEEIAWNICKQYRSMQDPEICRIYPRTSLGKNTRSLLLRIFPT